LGKIGVAMKKGFPTFEEANDDFKKSFIGWTIEDVKMAKSNEHYSLEGGLSFVMKKGNDRRLVVLGYTELGEWVESVMDDWRP
jgi:hypothetical protein